MGTSISTTLWDNRATLHHTHLVEQIGQGTPAFTDATTSLTSAGLPLDAAYAQINRLIDVQAYTRAADDIFLASAVVFLMLIAAIWMTRRPPRMAHGAGAVDAGGAH